MKLKLSAYLKIAICCLTIFAFVLSIEVGLMYAILLIQVAVYPLLLKNKPNIYKNTFFIIVFSVVIVYYLRPILLLQNQSFYYYDYQTGSISPEVLIQGLYRICVNTFFLISSYVLYVLLFIRDRKRVVSPTSINADRRDYKLLHNKMGYITSLLLFLSGIRLFLILGLNVGMKGVAITSSYAFLARFAPEDFVIGIVFTIFIMFRKSMDKINRFKLFSALIMMSLAFVATGSKAIVVLIIFFFLIYDIFFMRMISLRKFSVYSVFLIVMIPLSFYLGNAVKVAAYVGNLNFSTVVDYTIDFAQDADLASSFDVVTNRFIGVDGYLAKGKIDNELLFEVFGPKNISLSVLYMLIPFSDSNYMSTGVAVGRVVEGFGDDVVHAGALGGYSGLELMFQNVPYIGIILFSAVILFGMFLIEKIRSLFVKYMMFFFYSYFILIGIMSGNFDVCIAMLLLKLVLFYVYLYPVYKFKVFKR